MPIKKLLATRASNDLANLLHILADTRNRVAAGGSEGDECEGDYVFHAVPVFLIYLKILLWLNTGVRAPLNPTPGSEP
jgi:hypothetical protein